MTYIGKNIRKIRTIKGYSQTEFANIFGLTRASIGAYEEGRAEPKAEITIQIAKHFSIPIDTILTKEVTVNEITNFDIKSYHEFEDTKTISIPFISSQNWNQFTSDSKHVSTQQITFPTNIIKTEIAIQLNNDIKNLSRLSGIKLLFCSEVKRPGKNENYLVIYENESILINGNDIEVTKYNRIYKIDFILNSTNFESSSIEARLQKLEDKVFNKKS